MSRDDTKIEIYTGRKGSNPGGKCLVTTRTSEFDAYFKYCPGSRLPPFSPIDKKNPQPFTPQHQPIYEAITFALAQRMGLNVPEFQVLVNNDSVSFTYDPNTSNRINERMPFYLISKLIEVPVSEDNAGKDAALKKEKVFRDLLMVSDVSNKAQNFRYVEKEDRMLYLDLGCSFVNAVEGYLRKTSFKLPEGNVKKARKVAENIQDYWIATADGTDIKQIGEILDLRDLLIPTLTSGRTFMPVDSLLSGEEISELETMLLLNLITVRNKHKSKLERKD